MAKEVERSPFRFRDLQPPEKQRHCGRDRIRPQRRPIRVGEDQVEIAFILCVPFRIFRAMHPLSLCDVERLAQALDELLPLFGGDGREIL